MLKQEAGGAWESRRAFCRLVCLSVCLAVWLFDCLAVWYRQHPRNLIWPCDDITQTGRKRVPSRKLYYREEVNVLFLFYSSTVLQFCSSTVLQFSSSKLTQWCTAVILKASTALYSLLYKQTQFNCFFYLYFFYFLLCLRFPKHLKAISLMLCSDVSLHANTNKKNIYILRF